MSRASRLLTALAGACLVHACSGSPAQPAPPLPVVDPPAISCPAPVSLTSPTGLPLAVQYGTVTAAGGASPTTVACTPASGSEFPIGSTTVTCTATDAKQRTDSCAFAVVVAAPPTLTVARFFAFGDSITWGEDGTSATQGFGAATRALRPAVQFPLADTYPGRLLSELASRYLLQSPQMANAGLKGEAITDSTTFSRYTSYTSSGRYDVALIMEGANDLSDRDSRIEPAAIAGLRQMINDALSRHIRAFLATIPPENPLGCCPDRGLPSSLVPDFNNQVRALAASEGVPLVDIERAFNGDLSLIGFDGLHPTAAGYRLIADTFYASITQNLEQPAATSAAARPPLRFAPRRRP